MMSSFRIAMLLVTLPASALWGHHGRDFILLQDSTVPPALTGVLLNSFEWSSMAGDDEFSTEPGIFMGLAPFLGGGANVNFTESGSGWAYSSITPNITLTLPSDLPIKVSLWMGYQVAVPEPELTPEVHLHTDDGTAAASSGDAGNQAPAEPCGPDFGPDAPPCDEVVPHDHSTHDHSTHDHSSGGTTAHDHSGHSHAGGHSHSGIHRHGTTGLYTRLVFDANLGHHSKVVLNVINFTTANGKPGFGYAFGFRHEFSHDLSVSFEAAGDFDAGGSQEVLAAAQFAVAEHWSMRLGFGFGLTPASPDFSLHTGILWRF